MEFQDCKRLTPTERSGRNGLSKQDAEFSTIILTKPRTCLSIKNSHAGNLNSHSDSLHGDNYRVSIVYRCIGHLPPVSFLHLPMVAAVSPPVGDPALVFTGWTIPATGGPNVTVTLPTMVAVDPHVAPIRRRATAFVDRRRWANANRNLRKGGRGVESKSKQQRQCNLLHDESIPPGLNFRLDCRRKQKLLPALQKCQPFHEKLLRTIAHRAPIRPLQSPRSAPQPPPRKPRGPHPDGSPGASRPARRRWPERRAP
jgi:hypothetical protein